MKQVDGQMCLELFERTADTLCDTCRRLIWHATGDGYCCCTAPGMARITARTRKPLGSRCRFYEGRAS